MPTRVAVLQPGEGPIDGDHYLPATPATVRWGRLPSRADAPALTVSPGETVTIDTVSHEGLLEDQGKDPLAYFGGHGVDTGAVLRDAVAIASALARDPSTDGPHVVTGPIRVSGAMPGDLLEITVLTLRPRVPYGVISNRHGKGALPGELPRGRGNVSVFTPVETRANGLVGVLPLAEGGPAAVEFPLAPFLGTMGVAVDADERPHSVPPGAHGGNIDIKLLVEGTRLYLPVQVEGALAYVGDPHFAQGDGEVALTALEASLRATLRFDVVPRAIALAEFGEVLGPLVRTPEHLVPTGLDPDLNVAMQRCVRAALSLLQARYGMDEHLAYAYLSAATDFDISQVVDIVCGVHARIREADFAGVVPAVDRSIWRVVGDPLLEGAGEGPLAGLAVAVKDLFAIEGRRIGAGNPAFLAGARHETATARAVADLLRGGASVRGIARTDEFAYSIAGENAHYGTPPNGAVPGALPGGSSSGPASAVAAGLADVGLATDTAGSIRVPASYQGLWGLRTTHGLVPRQGLLPLAPSFDTVGWLTRDGDTLARVVDWCLSNDGSEELPWRFTVPTEMLAAADPATRSAFESLLAALAASPDAPAIGSVSIGRLDDWFLPFRSVQAAEAWRSHGAWFEEHPDAVGPAVAGRLRVAASVTPADEADARRALEPLRECLRAVVSDAVLLLPTVPGAAPGPTPARSTDDLRVATLRMTTPAAVAGLPALSVPLLTVPSPLGPAPVGVCVVGRAGADIALVRLGRRLQGALA